MTTVVVDIKNQVAYADKVSTRIEDKSRNWLEAMFLGQSSLDKVVSFVTDTSKLRRNLQGYLLTGSGLSSAIDGFCDWPAQVPDCPSVNTTVLILIPRGDSVLVVKYQSQKARSWWQRNKWIQSQTVHKEGYICLGSGSDYAMGAVMAGVHPEQAIQAASKIDVHTGHEVDSLSLAKEVK